MPRQSHISVWFPPLYRWFVWCPTYISVLNYYLFRTLFLKMFINSLKQTKIKVKCCNGRDCMQTCIVMKKITVTLLWLECKDYQHIQEQSTLSSLRLQKPIFLLQINSDTHPSSTSRWVATVMTNINNQYAQDEVLNKTKHRPSKAFYWWMKLSRISNACTAWQMVKPCL